MKFLGHHEKLDKGEPLPILNPATSPDVVVAQSIGGWSGSLQKIFSAFLSFCGARENEFQERHGWN